MTRRVACLASWALVVFSPSVFAQDIYRCGSTYSQVPCGDSRRIELTDARSDEQRRQALQVNERTVALAESLERDRLASEAAARSSLAGRLNAPAKKASTKEASRRSASQTKANAKPKKQMRPPFQAVDRRAPKATQDAVLAQPRP